jgi:hypothetical protein
VKDVDFYVQEEAYKIDLPAAFAAQDTQKRKDMTPTISVAISEHPDNAISELRWNPPVISADKLLHVCGKTFEMCPFFL